MLWDVKVPLNFFECLFLQFYGIDSYVDDKNSRYKQVQTIKNMQSFKQKMPKFDRRFLTKTIPTFIFNSLVCSLSKPLSIVRAF